MEENKIGAGKARKILELQCRALVVIAIIVIIGNIFIEPPLLFHGYGHFGFILHPIKVLKQLYFSWGTNNDSFVFSLTGLRIYFNAIPVIYAKFGFLKATFAFLTQFSPIWAFFPAQFLIMGCLDFIRDSVYLDSEGNPKEENKNE